MKLQHQFEIRQMALYGCDKTDRKRMYEQYCRIGFTDITNLIASKFPFKKHPFGGERYELRLLVLDIDEYTNIRTEIRDLLYEKLDPETFKKIGELFKKLEANAPCDNNSLPE